jgi:altronate dehydratase small subunit
MTSKPALIVIREKDNVATATRDISAGELLSFAIVGWQATLTARQDIRFLHKVALRDIAPGERVYKYGAVIGEATRPIAAGEHVHVHNIRSLWGRAKS